MGVTADLCGHVGRLAVVILAQLQTVFSSQFDQVLAAFLQQAAVGGMRYRFGHHSGIDDDFVQAAFPNQACCAGRLDGHGEQDLDTLFANALSPAAQARTINGQLCLQMGLPAKVLPVGVFQPGCHHRFVRGIVGMLQIQQSRHQARTQCRSPPA